MDFKLALVFLVLVALAGQLVYADMYYDRFSERAKEVTGSDFKCSPGTTTVRIVAITRARESESESDSQEALRTHMNSGIEEKSCLICVCSVDGTEEHCRGRPARNVNECLRIDSLRAEMERGLPYDHDRILAYRIRRGGDALCCDHPSGHRRNLHLRVRDKLRQLRRKVPRENILGDSPRGDYVDFIVNND